ncbi:MAG: hypothetical protein K0Q71_5074, partial [Thermomicrobiales bacterium]|nr:hypothetical protein [Thermomicrobiales bacterium]
MDHDRFDGLTRSLGAGASRRGLGRALAGGGLGALLGSAFGPFDADARKKKHKKKRKKNTQQRCARNCVERTCGNDGCGGSCGTCGANQVCQGGTCCTPEPRSATCGGRCGTWTNNCGQPVTCATCAAGQQCLSNGSCAIVCIESAVCPVGCGCSAASVEGAQHCVVANQPSFLPPCTSTLD